jgi:hypothetical protein
MNELSPVDDGMNPSGGSQEDTGEKEKPYRGFARMIADQTKPDTFETQRKGGSGDPPVPLGSQDLKELKGRSHRDETAWAG